MQDPFEIFDRIEANKALVMGVKMLLDSDGVIMPDDMREMILKLCVVVMSYNNIMADIYRDSPMLQSNGVRRNEIH